MAPRDRRGRFVQHTDEPLSLGAALVLLVIALELAFLAYFTGLIRPLG